VAEGIVLAAGRSSRSGEANKLGFLYGGRSMLDLSVSSLAHACTHVYVVTGYRPSNVEALLAGVPKSSTVHNPDYERGMLSSVLAGLKAVAEERCFILPADCPLVCRGVALRMLEVDGEAVIPEHDGRPGHPVLIGRKAMNLLASGAIYDTLRDFLKSINPTYMPTDCPGVLCDIDTKEDYAASLSLHKALREGGML
jgi:molybdenum cofactor cytidylyltransferase